MTKADGRFSTVIRKSVRKLFFKEPNKGKLINDLLEEYYFPTNRSGVYYKHESRTTKRSDTSISG